MPHVIDTKDSINFLQRASRTSEATP